MSTEEMERERHATTWSGDCPHWCRACRIEDEERRKADATPQAEPRGCPTPGACSCPQLQPLTEHELSRIFLRAAGWPDYLTRVARAVEAAHGIGTTKGDGNGCAIRERAQDDPSVWRSSEKALEHAQRENERLRKDIETLVRAGSEEATRLELAEAKAHAMQCRLEQAEALLRKARHDYMPDWGSSLAERIDAFLAQPSEGT